MFGGLSSEVRTEDAFLLVYMDVSSKIIYWSKGSVCVGIEIKIISSIKHHLKKMQFIKLKYEK